MSFSSQQQPKWGRRRPQTTGNAWDMSSNLPTLLQVRLALQRLIWFSLLPKLCIGYVCIVGLIRFLWRQMSDVCISRMHDNSPNHILRLTFEIHYEEHCTIDATKYFFSNRVINTWNNLPDMVVHSPTLSTFKRHLSVIDLTCHS